MFKAVESVLIFLCLCLALMGVIMHAVSGNLPGFIGWTVAIMFVDLLCLMLYLTVTDNDDD